RFWRSRDAACCSPSRPATASARSARVDTAAGPSTSSASPSVTDFDASQQSRRDRKSTRLKLQSHHDLVCRLLIEKKKNNPDTFPLRKKHQKNNYNKDII